MHDLYMETLSIKNDQTIGASKSVTIINNTDDEDEEDVSMDVWMGTDPFYDRFPWFRLVGRLVFYWILIFFELDLFVFFSGHLFI